GGGPGVVGEDGTVWVAVRGGCGGKGQGRGGGTGNISNRGAAVAAHLPLDRRGRRTGGGGCEGNPLARGHSLTQRIAGHRRRGRGGVHNQGCSAGTGRAGGAAGQQP